MFGPYPNPHTAHPALTADEARRFEQALFAADESKEWPAMQRAGRALAETVLRDFSETGPFPTNARVLVLAGKGHNGGDAFLAAARLLEKHPGAHVEVCLVFGERALRPLALHACELLAHQSPERISQVSISALLAEDATAHGQREYDLLIDGVFGFQFRPPVEDRIAALFARINAMPIRLRAAVDLPSGLGDAPEHTLRADFTYATGIVKTPLLADEARALVGRIRYLDLGFWDGPKDAWQAFGPANPPLVLTHDVLKPLNALRPSTCDKRDFGHLFILGGSRHFPGAIIMSVLAALRSGAGLVTAFVPASIAAACAARAPEAMWFGWPETPEGGLALEGAFMIRMRMNDQQAKRPTAVLIGPGLGRERESLALVSDILRIPSEVPLVLDADALQPEVTSQISMPHILTPHAGEFARISSAISPKAVLIRKGPLTRIEYAGQTIYSPFGGPVLARGGSGDLLAGLTAGLLAQQPSDPVLAAARGAVWHGMAADALARAHGQQAVHTTQLLDYLGAALRGTDSP